MCKMLLEEKTGAPPPARRRTCGPCLWLPVLLAFCLATGTARAQNGGSVFGTVGDSTGAVLPGANATLTDPEHGFTRTVTSNSTGGFLFPDVPIGTGTYMRVAVFDHAQIYHTRHVRPIRIEMR